MFGLESSDPPVQEDDPVEVDPAATETESEGVGGVPGLDPDERATVSDVDGDNVDTEHPNPQI